jgi:hypothetical protein
MWNFGQKSKDDEADTEMRADEIGQPIINEIFQRTLTPKRI